MTAGQNLMGSAFYFPPFQIPPKRSTPGVRGQPPPRDIPPALDSPQATVGPLLIVVAAPGFLVRDL
jgi:hypothetical protein